jgi:hypothetical protein
MTAVSLRPAPVLMAFAVVALVAISGCRVGGDSVDPDEVARDDDRTPTLREGLAGARDGLTGVRDAVRGFQEAQQDEEARGRVVETVDFRRLRDLLPERAAGMDRVDASGERQTMGGFSLSNAKAEYRDDDRSVRVQITDAGGTAAFALLGAAWMMADFDRESSDGYERTTTFEGHRAYEKLEERRNRAQLQLVVANRFFVSAEGRNASMDDLRRTVRAIDLRGLEAMRDEGRER